MSNTVARKHNTHREADDAKALSPSAGLQLGQASVVGDKMRGSLGVVMGWQKAELPARLAFGSGDLRRLTTRVRKQPVNFMIIIHQSLVTAGKGTALCRLGWTAVRMLLGEEKSDETEQDKTRFMEESVTTIKGSASDLNGTTVDIKNKFRLLRTAVLDLHKDLDEGTEKQRSAFLTQLSRVLGKDTETCKLQLRAVRDDLQGIEDSLNLITQWWQKVESEANYLHLNGESSLLNEKNRITLKEIKTSFVTLEKYFTDYVTAMSQLYDENVRHLNDLNRSYLMKVRDCTELVVSKLGRLKPAKT